MAARATSPRGKEAIVFSAVDTGESPMLQCIASYLCPREWLLAKRSGSHGRTRNHESEDGKKRERMVGGRGQERVEGRMCPEAMCEAGIVN